MAKDVHEFVVACTVYQQGKMPMEKLVNHLHLMTIPDVIWEDISLDFVTGLPQVKVNSVIMVVVD